MEGGVEGPLVGVALGFIVGSRELDSMVVGESVGKQEGGVEGTLLGFAAGKMLGKYEGGSDIKAMGSPVGCIS